MKPYVTMEEVISTQGADSRTHRFLTAENGCTNGCASGTTIYALMNFQINQACIMTRKAFMC